MLIIYNKKLKLVSLKKIIKILKIKNPSFYRTKTVLLFHINNHKCAVYIQTIFRKKIKLEKYCPLSLELLVYPFISIKTRNKFNYYNFIFLVKYFHKSNDFRDPLTRANISDDKIKEINLLIKYFFKKKQLNILLSKSMIIKAELESLSSCIDSLFDDINSLYVIRINFVYSIIIPQLIHYFNLILHRHPQSYQIILDDCLNRIENHPCKNKKFIIDYLCILKEFFENSN